MVAGGVFPNMGKSSGQFYFRGLVATLFVGALVALPAGATTINLNPISTATNHIGDFVAGPGGQPLLVQPNAAQQLNADAYYALRRAANTWESILLDNIIINVWVDFASLGANVLGDAGPSGAAYDYTSEFLPQIANHLLSSPDPFLANLPSGADPFPVLLPAGFTFTGNITMSFANAKALGFTDAFLTTCNPTPGAMGSGNFCDGVMRFSRDFPLDLDRSDGVVGYDLEGIAMHELGHILGFFSEVDTIDCMLSPQCGLYSPLGGAADISMLDLYRFADCQRKLLCVENEPTVVAQFATATRYLGTADPAIFWGGPAGRFEVAQGFYTGDGAQASHWAKMGVPLGLMDPDVAAGELQVISGADRRAFQALGYDVVVVPEPGTVVLLTSGCLCVLVVRRRRRVN
jgi:hypothetical protein